MLHPRQQVITIALLYILAAWWPFQLELPYTVPNGMVVDARGVILERQGLLRADARPLVRAIRSKPGMVFQVELRIRTVSVDQVGPARILEIGQDHHRMNLMVGQSGDTIVARVRHSDSDTAGIPPLVARGVLAAGRATNVVLTVLSDQIELYIDGELIDARHIASTTETWSEDTVLTIGDSPVGERTWLGWLESGRLELDGVEILNIVESANDMRPERIHHIPGRIRNVLEHSGLPPTGLNDMLVNLLGFVPLGFLGARAWRIRPLHAVLLLVVCTSMTMELGQIAFADRTPSVLDLTLNLIGGMLGALLFSRIQPSDRV